MMAIAVKLLVIEAMRNTEFGIHRRLRPDFAQAGDADMLDSVAHHDRPGRAGDVLAAP